METTDTINIVCSIMTKVDTCSNNSTASELAEYMQKDPGEWFPWLVWSDNNDWSVISNLAVNGIIIGIIFAIVLNIIRWGAAKFIPTTSRDKILKWSFLAAWIYGFLVYDVGMCTGQYISLITNAPMAILYSFKIFVFDSDVSEIHEVFHNSWAYSLNFALAHFFAATISTLFLIKYFGFNILARIKMWFASISRTVSETYVFWGFNEQTINLVKSIKKKYSEESDKSAYRIVIVQTNKNDKENPEERTGFARIFDFLAMPTSDLERLQDLDCLTTGSYANLASIKDNSGNPDIIGKELRLKSLKKLLKKKTSSKIHLLFLDDDEKENLQDVAILLNDLSIKQFIEDKPELKREVIFYCRARYNSVHRVIEDRFMAGSRRVKVIDSSHISVENLKLDEDLLPVKYVKVEKDATVSTPFNSLVIGFSEVGQDSVGFLYEYGAFVKSGSTDTDVSRSDFHMRVVDKRMADVAGSFVANAPAINVSIPFIKGMENPDAPITLNQMDCQSIEFYKGLETWIRDLNYIVIATENDELNITVAIRIFMMAARYRKDMDNLCILTRVHKDEDGNIRKTKDHYNRLWKAQCAVKDYNGKIATQSEVKRNDEVAIPIHLFGLDKETYTYENIIDNSMEKQAAKFKERYTASTKKDYEKPECEDNYAWYKELRDNIHCINGDPEIYPTLSAVMGIRRMQGQDYANCFHSATKKILAKEALDKAGIPEFSWNLLTRMHKTTEYRVKDSTVVTPQVFRIINVLAQTEHLRWNASHEILGYVKQGIIPSRNEVTMHHSCITDWQDLTEEIQSFDYDYVDLSLDIINPDSPLKRND